jgi:hypothetical protein
MDCNSSFPAPAAGSTVYSTLNYQDDDDKGKRRVDHWSKRKRSPLFDMFCWFCFSFSPDSDSDSDSDDEEKKRDKKDEDGVVASMISAQNHFRDVNCFRL